MPETQCSRYEGCDAPLCPLADDLRRITWFPSEPVCPLRKHARLPWLRKQRRIQALRRVNDEGFFTVAMLEAVSKVRNGLAGADPNDGLLAEARWLQARSVAEAARQRHRDAQESPESPAIVSNQQCDRVPIEQLVLLGTG